MPISHNFDGGNIYVIEDSNSKNIQLRIREDASSCFFQWFYFRMHGLCHIPCNIEIQNAGGATYPRGFENYDVVYSYDRINWIRHPTNFSNGILNIQFTPLQDAVYFAYFAPYSMERHADLIARTLSFPLASLTVLGQTLDGRDLDLIQVSNGNNLNKKKNCWFIARQHPGETMAEWWMEGALEWLGTQNTIERNSLLDLCDLFLIPNMNPDGSYRGHLRTNAAGRNLNREWEKPTMETAPEVFLVKEAMSKIGVDFFLDIHGDESLPHNFIAGTEGLINWSLEKQHQLDFYKNALKDINKDFQTEVGYPIKERGSANLNMSAAQIASQHGCLAMTLEMPFKDTLENPNKTLGWSPSRCKNLSISCLQALNQYLKSLII
jgi:murein tripeptide amidase MpaA